VHQQSWVDGTEQVEDNNWNRLVYGGWVDARFEEEQVSVYDEAGASSFYPERQVFIVVVGGGHMLQVKTVARLPVELELETNFAAFDENRFRVRAANALGVSTGSISVFNLFRERNTVRVWRCCVSHDSTR